MQNLLGDIRYSLRQFALSPAFTLTAILTLALGIGGTTAIFSLIHAVMLRSLPVADPATLYRIGDGNDCCVEGGPQDRWGMFSFPFYERLKNATPEFDQLAAFQAGEWRFSVRRANTERFARPMRSEYVTGNYFSTLGIRSFAGRLFSHSDDQPASAPVAVLSYRAWQGVYGADPSVVGASYIIEGHPFTIIGIAPPGFFGETLRSDPPDLWVPLHQEPLMNAQGSLFEQPISAWLRVIGRLRPNATVTGLSARLTGVLRQWIINDSGFPASWIPELKRALPKQNINVVPAGGGVAEMKEDYGRSLQILLSVCGLVLLIACANIANLLLARGMTRRSQTSLRIAIGASRARIVSQSFIESILLGIAGGIAGLAVASGAARLILALAFHSAHFLPISTAPSLPVLGFAFALSLLTGVLFGTAPAWLSTHTDPVEALRGANRSTRDSSSFSQKALLVLQATLSVVLVAGAGMLTRSLNNLTHQDFGFKTANRITVSLNAPPATYTPERLQAVYRNLEDRLNHLPGVERASLSLYNPFTDNWGDLIFVAGHPAPPLNENSGASWDRVSPEYFQAVGQPILRGRAFTDADNENTAPVAIVNETFIRRFLPKEDPMDKHFGIDLPAYASTYRIVGVVRDAKYIDPDKPARPMFFVPLAQQVAYKEGILQQEESRSHLIGNVLLVTGMGPGAIEPVLRKTFGEADPNLTIISVRTLQQQVDLNFDQQRAVADLAGLFGIVALILAAVGLYGVTAYTVAQRTSEIGVRMALGADRSNVLQLVLRGAFHKVALGLLLGIPLAIGAGKLISAQLYGIVIWDPFALSVAVISLAICAWIAAIIPARRAAGIDPMQALRSE
ncbi:MAG: ABC transporter permease [Acidobacteriaceae bacterium]|nr:ABC transporter permease [Acidobacteriaceae bacterium]